MNRSEDNTCEHCRSDLPREAVGTVHFCSVECFEANESEAGRLALLRAYRGVAQQAADCMGLDGTVDLVPISLLPERP